MNKRRARRLWKAVDQWRSRRKASDAIAIVAPTRSSYLIENLENRLLLSLTLTGSGMLTIAGDPFGTPNNDSITLRTNPSDSTKAEVVLNGITYDSDDNGQALTWASINAVNITGGLGNDTINIENTVKNAPVIVSLGSGTDAVNISPVAENLANIKGAITIEGTSTGSQTTVNDQNGAGTVTVTSNSFTAGSTVGKITYTTGNKVTLNSPGNVSVTNTSASLATFINAAAGATVTVGAPTATDPTNSAQNSKGVLSVAGVGGLVNLTVDDSQDVTAHTIAVGADHDHGWHDRHTRRRDHRAGRGDDCV